jgi:hypothetical protein
MKVLPTLFLGLFTLLGLIATAAVAIDWLQGVDTYTWEAGTCTIESSEVVEPPGESVYTLEVSYRYLWRGDEHRAQDFQHGYAGSEDLAAAERLAAHYSVGTEVQCWVDPDEPESAYLRRANLFQGLWIFAPLLFVAAGGGGLWMLHRLSKGEDTKDEPIAPMPIPGAEKKTSPFKAAALLVGFFGLFFLAGAGMFIPFFVVPALKVVEARSWREVPCAIVSSTVRTHQGDDGATYSIDVLYRYEIDGREHRSNRYQFMGGSSGGYDSKAEVVAGIPPGTETTCYVDPNDPFEAVMERGFTTDYFFGLIPLVFAVVGFGGMVLVVMGARAVKKDAGRPSWGTTAAPAHAGAYSVDAIASGAGVGVGVAAGTTGPITLEPAMGRVGKLGCTIGIALLWNGITAPFVWIVVKSFREGNPEWFVAIVIIPFVLIGLLFLVGIPYSILGLVNPKPRVTISQRALRAGESVQIDWSFVGMASRIRRVKIWLESSKTTTETVRRNRSVSTQTRTVPIGTIDILERGREHGAESGSVSFTLPEDTQPSSDGAEAISWKLKVQGDIAFWPDVLEEFPIPVLPATSRG